VAKAGRRRWNVTASSKREGDAAVGRHRWDLVGLVFLPNGAPANSATIALTINGQVKTYRMATLQIVTLG
jgi:hypothetical protein